MQATAPVILKDSSGLRAKPHKTPVSRNGVQFNTNWKW